MRRLLVILLLLVAALFSFAVAQDAAEDTVQIGVITSITGRFAEFGEQHQAGFVVALEDVTVSCHYIGIEGRLIMS